MRLTVVVVSSVWLLSAMSASAALPHLVRYQGQAVDSKGVPLEGPYDLTFRLYDAQTSGTKVWEETQADVVLTRGHFSVLLGQVTPLTVDWSKPLWLSVQVDTEPELSPRQRITSVPLAIVAERLVDSETISPQNLLRNGSFESWSAGPDARPEAWDMTGGVTLSRSTSHIEDGSYSARFQATPTTGTEYMEQRYQASPTGHVILTGRRFSVSARVYVASGTARLGLRWMDTAAGAYVGAETLADSSGTGWQTLAGTTGPAPANASRLDVLLQAGSSSNDFYWDRVVLVEGPMPFAFSPHPQDSLTTSLITDDANRLVPSGAIILWNGASCPSGYTRLSALDGALVKLGATSAAPTASGASELPAHTHTGPSHTHPHAAHRHTFRWRSDGAGGDGSNYLWAGGIGTSDSQDRSVPLSIDEATTTESASGTGATGSAGGGTHTTLLACKKD